MPQFVPAVPGDWNVKEAQQVPYVLGVIGGAPAWRSVVVHDPVYDEDGDLVTATDRPVFVE